jgi:hypothetical protein
VIADDLNRDGIQAKNGGQWYASTVRKALVRMHKPEAAA